MGNRYKFVTVMISILLTGSLLGCAEESFSQGGHGGLFINEVVSSNAYSLVDEDLGAPDWIEIYNGTGSRISLREYGLSDNVNDPYKWTFPDISIAPDEYLVLYAMPAPEDDTGKNDLCTGFKVSSLGETLVLTDPSGGVVHELAVPELLIDISFGRNAQGAFHYFTHPTPGGPNSADGMESLDEIVQSIPTGAIRINELMVDNRSFLTDSDGERFGWVEICNTSDASVSLKGYFLTDNASNSTKWQFPDVSLGPGECLVVSLSGKDRREGELHTSFRLSNQEKGLWLADPTGALEDRFQWQVAPPANFSLGRDASGSIKYYGAPTPGEPNGENGRDSLEYVAVDNPGGVRINEFLVGNLYSRIDADGDRPAWAELYNASDQTVFMKDYVLTDDKADPTKWRFPDVTLEPGGYLLVFLSGKDRSAAGEELHTGFRLGRSDSELVLTNLATMESETIALPGTLLDNVSYGRSPGDPSKWEYYAHPTPGQQNATKGFEDIQGVAFLDRGGVWINEVSAIATARSGKLDWIEIANGGGEAVNLAGCYLSDDIDNPCKWQIPDLPIGAGGYSVVYASSKASEQKSGVAQFGISSAGERLMLSSPEGNMLDVFETGVLRPDVTSGRAAGDDSGKRVFFSSATPGKQNDSGIVASYTAQPIFSRPGGYASDTVDLSITCDTPDATIYYTLDGSKPARSSSVYSGPLHLTGNTVVKAIAATEGSLQSDMTVATFLFERPHTVPVVCLSGAQSDINAVYSVTQVFTQLEREGYVEYYEEDGALGVAFPAGLRVAGASTRSAAQKSLNMYLRGGYGQSRVTYPFFKDFEHVSFQSLRLRNSGQDRVTARIRDSYCAMAVRDMNLDYAEYRLVAVYINGKYWGLYDLRENQKDDYYAYRHNTAADNINRIKRNQYPYSGTSAEIKAVRAFARSKNMRDEAVFASFCEKVDADSAMDYIVAQTFFCNSDMFNQKYGRAIDYAFKWRFLFFDLDWGMKHDDRNIIGAYFNGNGIPSADGTLTNMDIQAALISNPGWKEAFIERYAYHLNNTFTTEKLLALFHEMVDEMEPEMERHIARWGAPRSVSAWKNNLEEIEHFLTVRTGIVKKHLKSQFNLSNERMQELFPNG